MLYESDKTIKNKEYYKNALELISLLNKNEGKYCIGESKNDPETFTYLGLKSTIPKDKEHLFKSLEEENNSLSELFATGHTECKDPEYLKAKQNPPLYSSDDEFTGYSSLEEKRKMIGLASKAYVHKGKTHLYFSDAYKKIEKEIKENIKKVETKKQKTKERNQKTREEKRTKMHEEALIALKNLENITIPDRPISYSIDGNKVIFYGLTRSCTYIVYFKYNSVSKIVKSKITKKETQLYKAD